MSAPTIGTRVAYRYTPAAGFPSYSGTGTVRAIWPGHLDVHPDGSGERFLIALHPSEVTPLAGHEQPALDLDALTEVRP